MTITTTEQYDEIAAVWCSMYCYTQARTIQKCLDAARDWYGWPHPWTVTRSRLERTWTLCREVPGEGRILMYSGYSREQIAEAMWADMVASGEIHERRLRQAVEVTAADALGACHE